VVADFSRGNAEKLVAGADVIVDGLDNFETRFLINDVALKLEIPWIYGGAIGSTGMTATFLPGEPPCFRCLVRSAPAGGTLTSTRRAWSTRRPGSPARCRPRRR